MNWSAVVVAAGRGTRFGHPKQFIELAGLPMVAWSLRAFMRMSEVAEIIVVTEAEWIEPMHALLAQIGSGCPARVVAGGATRQGSVRNGLKVVGESSPAVLIHDGARPLVCANDVRRGMSEVRSGRGAVLAIPVVDTIKVVDPASMAVMRTLNRETLWAAQTPQFAMRADFVRAHADAQVHAYEGTDDVSLLERIGVEVIVVRASDANFKVTVPDDVVRAESVLRERVQ